MPADEILPPDATPKLPTVDIVAEVRRLLPEASTGSAQRIGLGFEDRHGVRVRLYVPKALVTELMALVNGCLVSSDIRN